MRNDVSLISLHPFVREFVLSGIKAIKEKNYEKDGGAVIDADFVPSVSENVMIASMGMNVVEPVAEEVEIKPVVRMDMSELVAPIDRHVSRERKNKVRQSVDVRKLVQARPVIMPPVQTSRKRSLAQERQTVNLKTVEKPTIKTPAPIVQSKPDVNANNKYGKIAPLLDDASVSTIECLGEGKELMIIRAGQKQRTRISLNSVEINDILEVVADAAHIPLIEGVFRANVEGFSMNAVVSEMVGSRFVVKKATAYGLLE